MSSQPRHSTTGSTIGAVLAHGRRQLAATDTARLDSELLLAHVLQVPRTYLYVHTEEQLDAQQLARFEQLLARRIKHEPVAYLVGTREFWSLPLQVTPDTLIPRPETELLVEQVLAIVPAGSSPCIADLGTGSGAIAIALACEFDTATIIATDNNEAALQIATINADLHCPGRIEFRPGDWLQPLADERFDIIASNPPYIEMDDPLLQTTDIRHEPRAALAAGPDGLDALRVIVGGAGQHLNTGGWLLLEHGAGQARAVQQLLQHAGYIGITTRQDMAGLDRITMAQWPE